MQIDVPFAVTYQTPNAVPISEVIGSLVAAQTLIEEGGNNLSWLIQGLEVEEVRVGVRSISQESPLREVLLVSLFLAFQEDLEREVPELVEQVMGKEVPESLETVVTLAVLICLFYGVAYLKDLLSEAAKDSPARRQLNGLIKDMAEKTGRSAEDIRKFLDARYRPKSRIKALAAATGGFFRPSKSQSNAPIEVGTKKITREVVSDVPSDYMYEEALKEQAAKPFSRLELELHAQDIDHESSGWAAIVKDISEKRLRLKLVDGVSPGDLWGKNKIIGAGIVKYKRVGVDMVPSEIHLSEIHDS